MTVPDLSKPSYEAPDFSAPAVVVEVGTPGEVYCVNEKIICDSSGYFQRVLDQRRKASNERAIVLGDHEPAIFNIYVNWLYGGPLFTGRMQPKGDSQVYPNLASCYLLGGKLLDSDFRDAVVDAVVIAMDSCWMPRPGTLNLIWNNTVEKCLLRRAIVHRIARQRHINAQKSVTGNHPLGFVHDLLREMVAVRDKAGDTTLAAAASCTFHEHAPGEENCYRTKRGLDNGE